MGLTNTIIVCLLNILSDTSTYKGKQLPLWTWGCIDDKCVPTKATHDAKLQSLVTCKILCASFQFWPEPTGAVSLSNTAVPVRADLFYLNILTFTSIRVREHVIKAFELFQQDLRKLESNISANEAWHAVEIRVTINESGSEDPRMLFDTDESYHFRISPNNVLNSLTVDILANSFCGARHALETLSQLVWLDPYIDSLLMMDVAEIADAPRFPYRGLMLDTVSNYFSINDIIKTIDVMAASKLNTFHWHASDSQGVSVDFKSLSLLAYYELYKQGAMYNLDDVRTIIRYAQIRGIRVLLEVDMSALLCSAWNCVSEMRKSQYNDVDPASAYNCELLSNETKLNKQPIYSIIEKIYTEIVQITDVDDIFHLGGADTCEYCLQYLNAAAPNESRLQNTHNILERLESVTNKLPNLIILWSTNLSDRMKIDLKKYINRLGIQVRNVPWTKKHISGLRTVISHENTWDLNSGYGDWDVYYGGTDYNSWQRVYEHRPWSRRNMWRLEGGEATVWSSTLSMGGLEARVWPRVAALGERLWSDRAEGASQLVHERLDVHGSRLRGRSIPNAPLWSMWCSQSTC